MSELNHPLASESTAGIDGGENGGSVLPAGGTSSTGLLHGEASKVVTGPEITTRLSVDGIGGGETLGMPSTEASGASLALGLDLALVPEALGKNPIASGNENGPASRNTTVPASGGASTIPTPITMGTGNAGSVESSNPGTNKSSAMSGLRSSMRSVGSSHSSPIMSSEMSTNTLRMFQRMDEISARLIAMEEMFQKLCKSIDQQNSTIKELKLENAQLSKDMSEQISALSVQREQNSDTGLQDTFVTDLLNSITNVSSAYLRRMRPRKGATQASFRPVSSMNDMASLNSNPNGDGFPQHNGMHGDMSQFRNFNDRQAGHATFTLNPNGIKRRKKNNASTETLVTSGMNNSNVPSEVQSYKDLTSLNAFGTISLPNLTLDQTGMTPLLKGASNPLSARLQEQLANAGHSQQQSTAMPLQPNHMTDGMKHHAALNGDTKRNQEDDDDGYQEDDDDDNDSDASDDDDEGDDDDDEGEEEEQPNARPADGPAHGDYQSSTVFETGKGHHWNDTSFTDKNLTNKNGSKLLKDRQNNANFRGDGPNNGNGPGSNGSNDKTAQDLSKRNDSSSVHDEDYTLLKAPNNVQTIWEEYTVGIGGNPPIKKLEERFGNKWRLNRNRKTFARRKRLYKFILNGIGKGKTAEEMIRILEERRLYKDENGEVKRRTIGWLQQSLTGI